MRVLLASSKPFLPQLDGGNVASRCLYDELNEQGITIDYCTLYSDKHPIQPELFKSKNINLVATFKVQLTPTVFGALKSLLLGNSYLLERFKSSDYTRFLQDNSGKYDAIILDGLYATLPLATLESHLTNVWLRSHNLEHEIWQQRAEKSNNPFFSWYFRLLRRQLLNYSKRISSKLAGVLTISADEESFYQSISVERILFLPIKANAKAVAIVPKPCYFHFGSMNWRPNVESANIFVDQFAPDILKQLPTAQFKIAGAFMESFKKVIPATIENSGYVSNSKEFIKSAGILIAPIQSGSGVRIKILEALSEGVIVLTTSIGAQGINVNHFPNLFVVDHWKSFLSTAISLGTNPNIREQINKDISSLKESNSPNVDFKKIFKND
ncbi:MAG: glycosyltransferase [Bacteroidetes bacterium]|nr:glycosyltransferase [Bacteroidota bacterium]